MQVGVIVIRIILVPVVHVIPHIVARLKVMPSRMDGVTALV